MQKIPAIIAIEAGRDKIYQEEMEGLGFVASKRGERNGGLQSAENPVTMKEGICQNMFEKNLKLRSLACTKSSK